MPTIEKSELKDFATRLLKAGGFSDEEAGQTADLLVWANLRGVDSHGVLRIPRYIEMFESGMICTGQQPRVVKEFGATRVLDFGKAPGSVAMNHAARAASELAGKFGIGWCGARAISHAGAIGYFTSQIAERGQIGVAMTASRPLMSYFGARGEAVSTNPLSIAVPRQANSDPIVLDMSTAAVALGKIMAARDAGKSIPRGWAIDATGADTEDPRAMAAVLPMAGPKGSGLSLMIEILASLLVGNAVIGPMLRNEKKDGFNGLVLAIAPEAFGDSDSFLASVENLAGAIHDLEPAPEAGKVRLPGERGFAVAREREATGIPLAAGTASRLAEAADRLGVHIPTSLR
jgi:ureidoglycolate dehydrogenase (NAD+)